MKIGYARVSTDDQDLSMQHERLTKEGCEKLFEEKLSGANRDRPALHNLLDHIRKDDILLVSPTGSTGPFDQRSAGYCRKAE